MKQILQGVRIFAGGCDLTGQTNKVDLGVEFEEKDVTTFGSVDANNQVWKEVTAGLGSGSVQASGFWEAGDPAKVDNDMWATLGGNGPWTICPTTANLGDLAYLANAMRSSYSLLGAPGEVAPYQAQAASSWPVTRGRIVVPPTIVSDVSWESGYVRVVGGVPAGKYLYATVHILSVAGTGSPSFSPLIQSDDNTGFTSPTHRLTFQAMAGVGGQVLRVAGPITDEYFDVYADLAGTNPSFLAVAAIAVA